MAILSKEKFELMQKWQTLITLMGFNMEEIFDDWGYDADEQFFELLEVVERVNRLKDEPTKAMTAVLRTVEMGVTSSDINNYSYDLEERAEEARMAELAALESTNPCIMELTNDHNFKWVNSKQYPNHKHYSFTTKDGILVKGRSFSRGWGNTRNWLSWKDKNGKSVSTSIDFRGGINVPPEFPKSWNDGWNTTSNLKHTPMIIANYVIHKKIPNAWLKGFSPKFQYPKK